MGTLATAATAFGFSRITSSNLRPKASAISLAFAGSDPGDIRMVRQIVGQAARIEFHLGVEPVNRELPAILGVVFPAAAERDRIVLANEYGEPPQDRSQAWLGAVRNNRRGRLFA